MAYNMHIRWIYYAYKSALLLSTYCARMLQVAKQKVEPIFNDLLDLMRYSTDTAHTLTAAQAQHLAQEQAAAFRGNWAGEKKLMDYFNKEWGVKIGMSYVTFSMLACGAAMCMLRRWNIIVCIKNVMNVQAWSSKSAAPRPAAPSTPPAILRVGTRPSRCCLCACC